MKRILSTFLCSLAALSLHAQFGQINNGDFESWQNDTLYETPTVWGSTNTIEFYGTPAVFKSTDAQDGSYSAEIRAVSVAQDTLSGYVFHGDLTNYAGINYTTTFEAVTVQYKCDLPAGDTLFLILIRYNFGTMVDYKTVPVAYGTTNVWTPNLLYVGNTPQTELFIGFTLDNPNSGASASPNAWARIDNVQLFAGSSMVTPLPNNSFETWTESTVENPSDWYSLNWFLGNFGLENVNKTTDAYAGNYAVELSTIYAAPDTIAGILSMAPIDIFSPIPFSNAPFNGTPTLFSGAYKFQASNNDQSGISITFFEAGNPIGVHTELFSNQAAYTTFASALTITGTPDSIAFLVYSGDNPGSTLKLDNLQFSGGGVGIFENPLPDFAIYPNPATDQFRIGLPDGESFSVSIISIDGKQVYNSEAVSGTLFLPVTDWSKGIYTVTVSNGTAQRQQKLIVE